MTDQMTTRRDSSGQEIPADWETALQEDYIRDDERWSSANQVRDWLIIFAIGVFVFLWMFIVFPTEPGIR